ncbi:MAG TPA: twin-arginine translocase subunit TatC [Dermatophilaceae bacterium]|nr:twin-arginine translocase subunit TatC [Dermatophilaceae bacterium]
MARFRRNRDPEGRMTLGAHLRELRRRTVISAVAMIVGAVFGATRYKQIYDELTRPVQELAASKHGGAIASVNFALVTDPFTIFITVSLFVGVLISSPVWLYQIWAFVVPGLTRKEKRLSMAFIGAAVPLFIAGCYLAYAVLPRAVETLLSFAPESASNLLATSDYLSFVVKLILAFGAAFLLPVFLVGFNAVGVLPARVMIKGWRVAVFLCFLFTAIMTPTPDPWMMILMALPMVALYFLAVGIAWLIDRRRARRDARVGWLNVPDDQASAL